MLALAVGGFLTLLHTSGPRRLIKLLTIVTVYASPVAFVAILAGLVLLFVGAVHHPMRRTLMVLMSCGALVTGAILLMGCLTWAMRGLGR